MCIVLRQVPHEKFPNRVAVVADTDSLSGPAAKAVDPELRVVSIRRSREVKQSWLSTVFSTFAALLQALRLVWRERPALVRPCFVQRCIASDMQLLCYCMGHFCVCMCTCMWCSHMRVRLAGAAERTGHLRSDCPCSSALQNIHPSAPPHRHCLRRERNARTRSVAVRSDLLRVRRRVLCAVARAAAALAPCGAAVVAAGRR